MPQVLADTRYVSDNIFTYIHNGPGTQYRDPAASRPVSCRRSRAVNNDAGFTQVVDGRGRRLIAKTANCRREISPCERSAPGSEKLDEAKARLLNLNGDNERRFAEKGWPDHRSRARRSPA